MTFSIFGDARAIDKVIGWSIIGVPLAVLFLLGIFFYALSQLHAPQFTVVIRLLTPQPC